MAFEDDEKRDEEQKRKDDKTFSICCGVAGTYGKQYRRRAGDKNDAEINVTPKALVPTTAHAIFAKFFAVLESEVATKFASLDLFIVRISFVL